MELPINHKDLKTIVSALSLGGDTRLYFLLKNIVDSKSDDYQRKHGECDI